MRYLIAILSLTFLVVISTTQAQPHGWPCDYGYRPGNTWFYRSTSFQGKTYHEAVLRDSIGANGEYWVYAETPIFMESYWYRIDSACVFDKFLDPTYKFYQHWFVSRADSGDWWPVETFSTGASLRARVDDVYQTSFFGKHVQSKEIFYYRHDSIGETWSTSDEWAEGIGIVRRWRHPNGYDELVGAIIDGVHYGNTSGVDDRIIEDTKRVVLYPLPASENTTLVLAGEGKHRAVLELYDMLGRLVRRERMELLQEGATTTPLDVSGLAPGAYIVAVEIGGARYTTPLVVAR